MLHFENELLDGHWKVKISHVFREANKCANMLVSVGCKDQCMTVFLENPPCRVAHIVEKDYKGVSFSRLVVV
jgi:hypothetical protein